jgi:hypothetical protein
MAIISYSKLLPDDGALLHYFPKVVLAKSLVGRVGALLQKMKDRRIHIETMSDMDMRHNEFTWI